MWGFAKNKGPGKSPTSQSVLRMAAQAQPGSIDSCDAGVFDQSTAAAPNVFAGLRFDGFVINSIDDLTRLSFDACLNHKLDLAPSVSASVAVLSTGGSGSFATVLVSSSVTEDVVRSVLDCLSQHAIQLNPTGSQAWWCSVPVLTSVATGDVSAQQTRVIRARMGDTHQSALWQSFMEIVEWAFTQNANDIDFKVSLVSSSSQIFFKINGRYITLPQWELPSDAVVGMLGIVWQHSKGGAGSKFEPRQEQQCNVDLTLRNKSKLRLRWASMSTDRGCTVTMRLQALGSTRTVQTLQDAGYLSEQVEIFRRAVMGKGGLTTLAGTVGSGKTVTLSILINMLPIDSKIVSFEDPVEIENFRLHQKTISRDLVSEDDSDFQAGVRALFRSALDSFMLGETRDQATGKVIRAILESGHSAYTTTHAGSGLGIISKFASPQIGIPLDVLGDPGMLKLNVYQSLMLRTCEHCHLAVDDVASTLSGQALTSHLTMFEHIESLYGIHQGVFKLRNHAGCPKCRKPGLDALTGFAGRTVVAEMIEPDETMCELILENKKVDLHRYWRGLSDGNLMSGNLTGKSAMEIALLKAAQGLIDPREIEHHFQPFATLAAKAAADKALTHRRFIARQSISAPVSSHAPAPLSVVTPMAAGASS